MASAQVWTPGNPVLPNCQGQGGVEGPRDEALTGYERLASWCGRCLGTSRAGGPAPFDHQEALFTRGPADRAW